MANHHYATPPYRSKQKGLLSLMLSLPDNWDYTTRGLLPYAVTVMDAIRATGCGVGRNGYVIRKRIKERARAACGNRIPDIRATPALNWKIRS